MVYYHAINTFQMINCIVHGLSVHANERRILIVPNFIDRTIPHYLEMKEKYHFFSDIIVVEYSKYNGKSEEFVENVLERDFDTIFRKYQLDTSDVFYVGAAHYYFSIYLIKKNYDFSIIEDGAGLLSRPERLIETINKQKVLSVELLKKYDLLYLNNEKIISKICMLTEQVENFNDSLAVDFNIVEEINKLDNDYRNKLLEFWNCSKNIDADVNSVVLLTQNFANLNVLSFEEQIYIYIIFIKIILDNRPLIIKTHPTDLLYYEELLLDVKVIKEKFPAELLPFVFSKRPNCIATISSTGIGPLKGMFNEIISFEPVIEKEYEKILIYYIVIKLLDFLKIKEIEISNVYEQLFRYLWKYDIKQNSTTLVTDTLCENEGNNFKNIIYTNINEDYALYDYYDCKHIIPININKVFNKKYFYERQDSSFSVLFYGEEKYMDSIKNFTINTEFGNDIMNISIDKLTDEQLYIKQLEGYIKALENRIEKSKKEKSV